MFHNKFFSNISISVTVNLFALFYSVLICLNFEEAIAEASTSPEIKNSVLKYFPVSLELRPRVDFWRAIFSKYGERNLVFHDRDHPEIIYSVLDFNEYYKNSKNIQEYQKFTRNAEESERLRIKETLDYLALGEKPRNAFERRIQAIFLKLAKNPIDLIIAASEVGKIRTQQGMKEKTADAIEKSGKYLKLMEKIFEENDVPIGLTRLPIVESSFNYKAYSSVGAAGIWQFMRTTAKGEMWVSSVVDERRDPIVATRSAAKYLKHAFNKFDSWPLAITSYNHGVGGVLRAVNDVGSKDLAKIIKEYEGESFGFASENFYSEFVAALMVEQEAEKFFPSLTRERALSFDEIKLDQSVSLKAVAKLTGSTLDKMLTLNPALMGDVATGKISIPSGITIKVPHTKGRSLLSKIDGVELVSWSGVSALKQPLQIAQAEINNTDEIELKVFRESDSKKDTPVGKNEKKQEGKILKDSNLSKISKAEDLQVSKSKTKIIEAKKVETKSEKEKLIKANPAASTLKSYTIRKDENLSTIAKKIGVPLKELIKINPSLNPKNIKPGTQILI